VKNPQEVDVIESKGTIPSKPVHSARRESSIENDATTAQADSAVRARAYQLYEVRGRIEGRADQDWYQAEADLKSKGQPGRKAS
jgi:hypothetical protein